MISSFSQGLNDLGVHQSSEGGEPVLFAAFGTERDENMEKFELQLFGKKKSEGKE